MRTGRKRNPNAIRDESGKSRGERFDPQPFLDQPHRKPFAGLRFDENGRDLASTEAVGYPLARLHANGLLNRDQLAAGNHYAACVYNYARVMGIPMGSPRSGALLQMQGGGFYRWEGEESQIDADETRKRIERVKSLYNDCHEALSNVGLAHRRGNKILIIMREICVAELEENSLWGKAGEARLGDLRLGLNAVHKILVGHKT